MFSISTDEENFTEHHATVEDAIAAAVASGADRFWIGEDRSPTSPESYWSAEDWLDHVSQQDDYDGDWADAWDVSSEQQRKELEDEVVPILAAWLDRHGLRPKHFCIDEMTAYRFDVDQGRAVKV